MDKYLLVGLGAFLGANMRYILGGWAAQKWGTTFPVGTLLINLTGSFALGLFLAAATGRFLIDPRWRLFLAIGFLGGYTTFSTFSYESVQLLLSGSWWLGAANMVGSTLLGVGAALLGIAIGRVI